ncbi:uncharacterized protein A4U43_C10F10680 [Asparagus officinalis]|uniref:Uncharacterized protein n=1 Tax=Asparagus officinalis TaxID=4686 RepID=A0A5P1E282_ASPOF|nr:uncharacterized protein A4U43_C10F10680 [Asparagus officinalis]
MRKCSRDCLLSSGNTGTARDKEILKGGTELSSGSSLLETRWRNRPEFRNSLALALPKLGSHSIAYFVGSVLRIPSFVLLTSGESPPWPRSSSSLGVFLGSFGFRICLF